MRKLIRHTTTKEKIRISNMDKDRLIAHQAKRKSKGGDQMKSLLVKLGIVLIGLAIFGYSEMCRADGAWVLWEKNYRYAPLEWRIEGAYPSYDACVKKEMEACKEKEEAYQPKLNPNSKCITTLGGHYHTVVGTQLTTEWKCLPDTVDPRK